MNRNNSIRGCIILKWKASGSNESVHYDQVLTWAKNCNHDFQNSGINPAPEFRNRLEIGDEKYLKAYLRGERFPFRIIDNSFSTRSIRESKNLKRTSTLNGAWRACLKCGRLNLVDAVYCSYCGQSMPRDKK